MNLKTLLIIKAAVCLVLGVLLLFAPIFGYGLFGAKLDDAGAFPAREYAASMLGAMFLTWFARNAGESQARRAIILDLFVYDAIGVVITLIAQLSGLFNFLGWGILIIYLFFAIGFGYFWFKGPAPEAKAGAA